jgi:hypothetical protein
MAFQNHRIKSNRIQQFHSAVKLNEMNFSTSLQSNDQSINQQFFVKSTLSNCQNSNHQPQEKLFCVSDNSEVISRQFENSNNLTQDSAVF